MHRILIATTAMALAAAAPTIASAQIALPGPNGQAIVVPYQPSGQGASRPGTQASPQRGQDARGDSRRGGWRPDDHRR